ncbi:hypothetical protein FNV43_RR21348 [Rhamnella rubrinervis]|uniref:Uncharacterized protein n=1 Tax=Rhamnella rubrinervis TaxID=2594499 RepID=A0A8K0E356_9ROSA|nr:hypothetical protein FNV43_RR21348 [Rhamnella rubrinervis]
MPNRFDSKACHDTKWMWHPKQQPTTPHTIVANYQAKSLSTFKIVKNRIEHVDLARRDDPKVKRVQNPQLHIGNSGIMSKGSIREVDEDVDGMSGGECHSSVISSKKCSTQTILFSWPRPQSTMTTMIAQLLDTTLAWIETPYTVLTTLISSFSIIVHPNPPKSIYPFPADCAVNTTNHSFALFYNEALEKISYSLRWCQSSVDVAMDMAEDVSFTSLLDMSSVEISKIGFLLN